MAEMNRRRMLTVAAATAVSYQRVMGANERVQMGYIGLGNRGDQVHDAFLEHGDQTTVAVCDLRDEYMDFAIRKSRATPRKYADYRHLLQDKNVEAVAIATPDHWHALMFLDACRAGKDVYVEKPLSLTVVEGRRMVEVAAETKRIVQVGLHRRSSPSLKLAVDLVRGGDIGKVTVAKSFHLRNDWPVGIGSPPNATPTNAKEWDQWLGPAPMQPYNPNKMYYQFRWFYNFSGGQLTNFGVHYLDAMRWLLDLGAPLAVTAMGGKFIVEDNREIPDTLDVLWEYPGNHLLTFSQYNANAAPGNPRRAELEFRGTKGTLYLDNANWELVPEVLQDVPSPMRTPVDRNVERVPASARRKAGEPRVMKGSADTAFHARNFLDCVKSRQKTNCDTLEGHLSNVGPLLGNIALKTRAFLEWDPVAEKFKNNPAANRHLHYEYRAPYRLT